MNNKYSKNEVHNRLHNIFFFLFLLITKLYYINSFEFIEDDINSFKKIILQNIQKEKSFFDESAQFEELTLTPSSMNPTISFSNFDEEEPDIFTMRNVNINIIFSGIFKLNENIIPHTNISDSNEFVELVNEDSSLMFKMKSKISTSMFIDKLAFKKYPQNSFYHQFSWNDEYINNHSVKNHSEEIINNTMIYIPELEENHLFKYILSKYKVNLIGYILKLFHHRLEEILVTKIKCYQIFYLESIFNYILQYDKMEIFLPGYTDVQAIKVYKIEYEKISRLNYYHVRLLNVKITMKVIFNSEKESITSWLKLQYIGSDNKLIEFGEIIPFIDSDKMFFEAFSFTVKKSAKIPWV